jgi:nicotinamide-nucleotide amidase
MTAEIISIGDEILIGQIVNTNSVWIAQQLNLIGMRVVHMCTVSDNRKQITDAFYAASSRADFIFVTGGLGPTKDDITKSTLADFLQVPLVVHQETLREVEIFFTRRGRPFTEVNRRQAEVPEGCDVIRNRYGTAPGMWIPHKNSVFICMPGVPSEMKSMMTDIILPRIAGNYKLPFIYHKTVLTQGIGESALAEIVNDWEDQLAAKQINLAYLPAAGTVRLRLSSYGPDRDNITKKIDEEITKLQQLAGKFIYGYETYGEEPPTLEKIVSDILRQQKKTLSLAESCTGGYVSSLFTAIPGASEIFKGSVVPYTNTAKHYLLHVDRKIFETMGAVSKECVEQLARSALAMFNSDYSISISGIAGPTGGSAEKPVGTVWIAVADNERVIAKKFQFGENRQQNIIMTANAAINMLRKFIS